MRLVRDSGLRVRLHGHASGYVRCVYVQEHFLQVGPCTGRPRMGHIGKHETE